MPAHCKEQQQWRGASHHPPAPAADPRIKAAVVAAPALGFTFSPDGLKNVKVPVQLWRADDDVMLPHPRYAEAVRLALPETPDYHVVPNAGHFDFLVPCSGALASVAPAICTSAVGFDRAAFHASFDAAVLGFFNTTLGAGSKSDPADPLAEVPTVRGEHVTRAAMRHGAGRNYQRLLSETLGN
jgi:predicted dienelactone hydrolase